MTARRDLAVLESEGLALRTYGGAMLPSAAAAEGSFDHRLQVDVESKERLAAATADRISDEETVFVDSSTAAFYATRALLRCRRGLTIITNSLPTLELLRRASATKAIGLGGTYDPGGARFFGPDTVRCARNLLADKAVLSCTGLTSDGWLSESEQNEAEVKRTIIERSDQSILLLAPTDFRRRGVNVFASLEDISMVIHTGDVRDGDAAQLHAHTANVLRV
jgi:DeoR/GlpR family transcriptional regulator of sugar metabolism